MSMVIASIPVVFINPITEHLDFMPVEMINAYVPTFASYLKLEEAAKVAAIRDEDAAINLLASVTEPVLSMVVDEGCGFDILSVEPPSLR